jgi:phosphoribosylformylglycinamidine synthase
VSARVAVVQFPGVNCEAESVRALARAGLAAEVFRWTRPARELDGFDAYVVPGGFSYQDRVRAGVLAAKDPLVGVLAERAAAGCPVLGICNGAQVLVEAGLVPGLERGRIDLALAPNKGMGRDGYYANWVFVKVPQRSRRTAVTFRLKPGEVVPIPIAHCEGRFTSSTSGLFERLEGDGQIALTYCRADGTPARGFPDDPNGSDRLAAGISNPRGNVVAMMPHPERAAWLRQVPAELGSPWAGKRRAAGTGWSALEQDGPSAGMFRSIKAYIEECL